MFCRCIEKWLKGQGGKCPSCNEKAKMKDIRVIYAKAIKVKVNERYICVLLFFISTCMLFQRRRILGS